MWCCACVWRQHGIHYKQRVWAQCSGCKFPVMWLRRKRGKERRTKGENKCWCHVSLTAGGDAGCSVMTGHAVHLVHRCALFIIPWAAELNWNLIAYSWQMLGCNKLKTEANWTTSFSSMTEVLIVAILSWFTGLQSGQSGFRGDLLSLFKTSLNWFKMFSGHKLFCSPKATV